MWMMCWVTQKIGQNTWRFYEIFFERVRKANLCLRPSKCKIGFDQVKFLGHTLQGDYIKPQDESVGRILNTERPKTKKSCRSLLGMIHFYRRTYQTVQT